MTTEFQFPLLLEVSDEAVGMRGFLAIESLQDGLAFGGLRIHPHVTGVEVQGLARSMHLKLGAHGHPVGGAKGGLCCDPGDPALHEHLRAYAHALRSWLENHVILGKDMGATNAALDAMYSSLGIPQLSIVMAKHPGGTCPERIRDLNGYRRHMTGLGVVGAARAALGDLRGARVVIQGAGVVGVGTAVRLREEGAVVVGMSDVHKALIDPMGLDAAVLASEGTRDRCLVPAAFPNAVERERDTLFSVSADLLILAASSWSVSADHAEQIIAPLVVEGCNMGLVDAARDRLHARGVRVVDDILASSSSAAMVCHQIATGNGLGERELWERITSAITTHVQDAVTASVATGGTLRSAYLSQIAA